MDNLVFWLTIVPMGLILWFVLIGFTVWFITEPLADTAKKIGKAFRKGKSGL